MLDAYVLTVIIFFITVVKNQRLYVCSSMGVTWMIRASFNIWYQLCLLPVDFVLALSHILCHGWPLCYPPIRHPSFPSVSSLHLINVSSLSHSCNEQDVPYVLDLVAKNTYVYCVYKTQLRGQDFFQGGWGTGVWLWLLHAWSCTN